MHAEPAQPRTWNARRSLAATVTVSGTGLFTGAPSTATIRPASAGEGISFLRTDLGASPIPATVAHVADASRRTVLALDPADPASPRVETVEHALSALVGLAITDALIEVDAPELPAGTGDASLFAEPIRAAGVVDLPLADPPGIIVETAVRVEGDDGSWVSAEPPEQHAGGLHTTYHYDLRYGTDAPIPDQSASYAARNNGYAVDIAPARTFCLEEEAIAMRQLGMFKTLTPKDFLVIGAKGPIDNAYRFDNEPARHKVLDMIGDLALTGMPVLARFSAHRSGHALNHELARKLLSL